MFPRAKNWENRLFVQHLAARNNSILTSQYHHAQRAFVPFLLSAKTWLMPLKAERYRKSSIKLPGTYLFQALLRGAYLREGGLINLPKWSTMVLFQMTRRWCHFFIKNYKVEMLKQWSNQIRTPSIWINHTRSVHLLFVWRWRIMREWRGLKRDDGA